MAALWYGNLPFNSIYYFPGLITLLQRLGLGFFSHLFTNFRNFFLQAKCFVVAQFIWDQQYGLFCPYFWQASGWNWTGIIPGVRPPLFWFEANPPWFCTLPWLSNGMLLSPPPTPRPVPTPSPPWFRILMTTDPPWPPTPIPVPVPTPRPLPSSSK